MTIREQLEILYRLGVEFVVVGGQAGVLRQAVEFSHDLDILFRPTPENAERLREAVRAITGIETDIETLCGRDFQQYIRPEDGVELDVHLKLIAIPDFESGVRNSSSVEFLGLGTECLELPGLYASKRTDRPKDAIHRRAIEDRLRYLALRGELEMDEVILALCLDTEILRLPAVSARVPELSRSTSQPLLQARLLAHAPEQATELLRTNASLHSAVAALLAVGPEVKTKILGHPARLAALLAKLPLELPPGGYHVRAPEGRA
ncbi:hypothetical protein [Sorangium sp. So ce131]|uniref:hypothetical protein n=1 Tax=Sorangium sp. So ce131 TaxID=3133282 RepID=UPI003F60E63E